MKAKEQRPRKTGMARLWELALTKKILVIVSCVFAVVSVAVSFVPFVAVYYIIRELVAHYADLSAGNSAGQAALDTAYMIRLGWLAAGGAIAAILLNFFALMCSHFAAFTTLYKLKLDFTRHIASLPMGFHTANSTGRLRKIVDENIEKLEGFIAHQLPDLAGSFAMPVITLVILFVFDWRLGLASLVPIIISYLIQMVAYSGGKSKIWIKTYQDSLEDMNNAAVEYVRGISVVKAFNQTIYSFRKFYGIIKNYGEFVLRFTLGFKLPYVMFMLVINHVYLFLIPVIILISGAADYAQFALVSVFYLIFSVSLPTPFTKMMYVSQLSSQIADGIERMDKVLDTAPLVETKSPKTVRSQGSEHDYTVAFENVTFSYNGENESVALQDVSFTAKQGEVTALVGPSGSGKSTLAHLIPRFYDTASGAVKIGGTDIRDMSTDYLMGIVSFVFQDVFLFKQSIFDNIKIGNSAASREDIIAAARAAQCHDFIKKLPEGYDTVIGGANMHLSGGERQRIVIARAILKDSAVIVLDEATAFADPENEQKIQAAFEKLMSPAGRLAGHNSSPPENGPRGRGAAKTVIIIAHRLSTVQGANKIVVIDGGRVVETGRHDALVNAGGKYSRMWESYSEAMNWGIGGKNV